MSDVAKHIIFKGRVQGVGFRFTAYGLAKRHCLAGQVRNLHDGSVEMIAQGLQQNITDCIADLQENFSVRKQDITITEIAPNPSLFEFKITY